MRLPRAVEEFRVGASISDARRDRKYVRPEAIRRYENISYGPYGKWNLLDIYCKKEVVRPQPTIIDIHGGGWCYGNKELYQYYCMDLAMRGFTVVNFSYRLAPENTFPSAIEDINAVFCWVAEHADSYEIDLEHLYIAGDSAGAQLASQYAAMLTNPEYAALYPNIQIPSDKISIKAALLNCGIYDMKNCIQRGEDELYRIYLADSYENIKTREQTLEQVDMMKYLTSDFPPSYVMTSTYDFLRQYARPMYEKLVELGIFCIFKTYGEEDDKTMGHVFHLDIEREAAKQCNDEQCEFLRKY
ncbi:MAG: alpha/beta hydrolase [Lachnospiraceae bacterium]